MFSSRSISFKKSRSDTDESSAFEREIPVSVADLDAASSSIVIYKSLLC